MPLPKRDGLSGGGNSGKTDNRTHNGSRADFRTDTAISNKRFGNERTLQPWIPDADDNFDGSLDHSAKSGAWDQFAENERRFGIKSNYDESFYTTSIDKSHPQYRERMAAAEKKAREIERSAAVTTHVAEERVMDYVGGANAEDDNEEDKYSGVRRQDYSSLSDGRQSKYTPPAKRAPTGQCTTKGAPVDPAIISSQIRATNKKASTPTPEQSRLGTTSPNKNGIVDVMAQADKAVDEKSTEPKSSATLDASTSDAMTSSGQASDALSAGPAAADSNTPPAKNPATPSATSTVEKDVLKEFKSFATQQRSAAEKFRSGKAKADKEVRLTELKKFADSFKLSTPVPQDLVCIIAKDPAKRQEIRLRAMKNAEDVAKAKAGASASAKDQAPISKDTPSKPTEQPPVATSTDTRHSRGPATPHQTPSGPPTRHNGPRQQYPQQQYHGQPYRNSRNGPQHFPQQQQPGNLAHRLRTLEQQKFSQPPTGPQHTGGQEMRLPPTGPSIGNDGSFNRRHSALPGHMGAKLNPNSHEFKPSPFAPSFNPSASISASSSPRSAANHASDATGTASTGPGMFRRKTKPIDLNKCTILSSVQTIKPPQGRNWDENVGMRPAYDTIPTWRQLQDDEKADSMMRMTYAECFLQRQPFPAPVVSTPNSPPGLAHVPHQHQFPFHLQQGAPNMAPRHSPHIPHMRMDAQSGHGPHPSFVNDDHRMMQSNSAQSFASPRPAQVPVAYPAMNSGAQMQYNQPMYLGPSGHHMGQFRSFSNNAQYGPPQQGHMGAGPMMLQPQFMPGPQGMMGGPQMMYPAQHQFVPPSGPPQPIPGTNGYPSPGRPAAPMMAYQGSQQGHQMYMSPSVQYSHPVYGPGQQPSMPMSTSRGFNNAGPQQYGASPQQGHHYAGPQQRGGNSSHNKSYGPQGQPQAQTQTPPTVSSVAQSRSGEGSKDGMK